MATSEIVGRDRPTRALVVGSGFMGRVHARAIRVAGGDLAGVVVSSEARQAAAAAELQPGEVFTDLEQAIEQCRPDVVHVCTPNDRHAAMSLLALTAGLHVVCEKPLAMDMATAGNLCDAARGRVATVPYVYRFHPMVREARAMIAAGTVGGLNVIQGSYQQDWLLSEDDDDWRVDPTVGGPSRAFADIGTHLCDLIEFVSGDRIARLVAQTRTIHPRRQGRLVQTEDIVTLQFETANGVPGTCVVSQVTAGRNNSLRLEVAGRKLAVAFDQEDPERLWVGQRGRSTTLVRDPDQLSPGAARYARLPAGHAQGYQDCFDTFVQDTYRAMAGHHVDGLPTFLDGFRAAQIAEAVMRSARERTWTEVDTAPVPTQVPIEGRAGVATLASTQAAAVAMDGAGEAGRPA